MMKFLKKLEVRHLALLVAFVLLIVAFVNMMPKKEKSVEKSEVKIAVCKGTAIVNDNDYVYFTAADGNIMRLAMFESEPELFLENKNIMAMDKTHFLVNDGEKIYIMNKEEKGIEQAFSVMSDKADFSEDGLYYIDEKTKNLMKIDRETMEESVVLPYEIVDFDVDGTNIAFTTTNKKKGIITYDLETQLINQYVLNTTVKEFTVDNPYIIYCNADEKGQVYVLNTESGLTVKSEGIKAEIVGFGRGVIYYIKNKSGNEMIINFDNEYQ